LEYPIYWEKGMSRNFWIISLVGFANLVSFTILIPILYLYGQQFGLNDLQISFLFAIYAVAQFFSTPVIGKLSDRFGRKPLLIISLAGTVIANFLAGTATVAPMLFFARFLDGITGGNVSVSQAVVSDITPPQNRAKAFGLYGALTFGLGFILGPLVSLFSQRISLGAGFLVSSAIALVALLLTIFFLPETIPTKAAQSTNIFDLGLGNLIKGLSIPGIGILVIINFLIGTTFTIFTFAFQPYFLKVLGQDNEALTLMFVFFGVLAVIMQTKGISILTRTLSLVKILFLGVFIRSLTFVLMPVVKNIFYFIGISTLFSIFNALVQPMITTLISLNAKPQEQGSALGLNASYLNVSNAFGPLIAGAIVDKQYPQTYAYPLYLSGVLTFAVLLFAIANRDKYTPQTNKPMLTNP
jgi:predicted MFS family arabinose efflux permease